MELEREEDVFLAGDPVGDVLRFHFWDRHLDITPNLAFLATQRRVFGFHWDLHLGDGTFSLSPGSLQLRILGNSYQPQTKRTRR